MYGKNKKSLGKLLEKAYLKRNGWGEEICHAKQEMELARHNFDRAEGDWIDVCAHALRAAELKYAKLLHLAKEELSKTTDF